LAAAGELYVRFERTTVPDICVNCVKDAHLKQLIRNEGGSGKCSLCGTDDWVLDTENQKLFQLIKALVRFYYSEWDYNTHWGGDSYESLFYGEGNRFFDQSRSISSDAYDDVVLSIVDGPVYEDYDKGVSVFAGYGPNGEQNMLLQSISSDLDRNILIIAERLKTENHFNLENGLKRILEEYRDIASISISKDEVLYRARIGFKEKKRRISLGFEVELHYLPYMGSEIEAPPPYLAMNGRVNRSGVSFLYCATDKYTAISEVRPHPGDRVSIAKLRLNRDVAIFDLSDSKLINYSESDKFLDKYRSFNTLGVLMNKTIPPSERTHYSITQLIADCIRQIGFDGIIFNSTVGNGKNVVLFNQKDVEQVLNDADIVLIDAVKYVYTQGIIIKNDEDYE
jgi:RES domain-containing protein